MNRKKESVATLWADTLNKARMEDVRQRAVNVLVEQYKDTGGVYYQYGRQAWTMLCKVIETVFDKDGKDIVNRAVEELRVMYKDPSTLNKARAEHNHWRRLYIKKQLAELRAERSELILESEVMVEQNKH